jgi:hypothetical protein
MSAEVRMTSEQLKELMLVYNAAKEVERLRWLEVKHNELIRFEQWERAYKDLSESLQIAKETAISINQIINKIT